MGRLSESAAEGFRRPLEAEGIAVPREPLAIMVEESQCYPFFVQLPGRAVWRQVSSWRRGGAGSRKGC